MHAVFDIIHNIKTKMEGPKSMNSRVLWLFFVAIASAVLGFWLGRCTTEPRYQLIDNNRFFVFDRRTGTVYGIDGKTATKADFVNGTMESRDVK